jgi:hypothetical protein
MKLHTTLSHYWSKIQGFLFPWLEEELGKLMVRVRGHAKVMCHLIFGILAPTVDQLMRFNIAYFSVSN